MAYTKLIRSRNSPGFGGRIYLQWLSYTFPIGHNSAFYCIFQESGLQRFTPVPPWGALLTRKVYKNVSFCYRNATHSLSTTRLVMEFYKNTAYKTDLAWLTDAQNDSGLWGYLTDHEGTRVASFNREQKVYTVGNASYLDVVLSGSFIGMCTCPCKWVIHLTEKLQQMLFVQLLGAVMKWLIFVFRTTHFLQKSGWASSKYSFADLSENSYLFTDKQFTHRWRCVPSSWWYNPF